MHTYRTENYSFITDGDPCDQSPVIIKKPIDPNDRYGEYEDVARIPYGDLKAFVATIIRQKRIERLEQTTDEEILGV